MSSADARPPVHRLTAEQLGRCSFSGALGESLRQDGRDDQVVAEKIHISSGYMSRAIRGVWQQWASRLVLFMRTTNSIAALEKIADEMGCDVVVRSAPSAINERSEA